MAAEIPLGRPSRTIHKWIGSALGIPIGLGIAIPPHGLLLGIGGIASLTYIVGAAAAGVAAFRRFAPENNLALGALGRGELAKAHEVFVRWAPSGHPTISALARHNLGWTLMLEGRVDDAALI